MLSEFLFIYFQTSFKGQQEHTYYVCMECNNEITLFSIVDNSFPHNSIVIRIMSLPKKSSFNYQSS